MRKFRQLGLSLVLAVALLGAMAVPAFAGNPTVSITVTAQVVSITNDMTTWPIGVVAPNDIKYFSANNAQDDDYSTITNTGTVAVDVAISGTNLVAANATFNWVLAAAAGDQIYSLHANNTTGGPDYVIEVKNAETYNDITTDLAAAGTYDWSMKFVAPSAFHAEDDGLSKSATVTLVASKHV